MMSTPTTWYTESRRRVSRAERNRNAAYNQLARVTRSAQRFSDAVRSGEASMFGSRNPEPIAAYEWVLFAALLGIVAVMVAKCAGWL